MKNKYLKVHFLSQRLDWQIPKCVYQILDAEFSFDFDPCPTNSDFDGLKNKWGKRNFINPPYGFEIGKWLKKKVINKTNSENFVYF